DLTSSSTSRRRTERARLDLAWTFETPKPTLSDIPPPRRPHLLILPNSPSAGNQLLKRLCRN
ncbi:mCG1032467, partial [Mus musculus]